MKKGYGNKIFSMIYVSTYDRNKYFYNEDRRWKLQKMVMVRTENIVTESLTCKTSTIKFRNDKGGDPVF